MNEPNQPSGSPFPSPSPSSSPSSRSSNREPSPFESAEPTGPSGSGCSRPLLVGCSVLLVLLGVGAVLLVMNMERITLWVFERMEVQVMERLPEDLPEAERQRLGRAFDAVHRAVRDGTVDPVALQAAQADLGVLASKEQEQITVEDVRRAAEGLERAAGMEVESEDGG